MDVLHTVGRATWVVGELGWNLLTLLLRLNNAIISFFLSSVEVAYSIVIIVLSKVVDFAEVLCESVYFFVDDIMIFVAWVEKCAVRWWYWLRNGCGSMWIAMHEFASSTNSGLCVLLYLLYDLFAFIHTIVSFVWDQVVQALMLVGEAVRTIPKLVYLMMCVVCWTVESAMDYAVNMAYIVVFESANFFKKSAESGCRFLSDLPVNMYIGLVVLLATGTLGVKFGKKSHVVKTARCLHKARTCVGAWLATHCRAIYCVVHRKVSDTLVTVWPYISSACDAVICRPWRALSSVFQEGDSAASSPAESVQENDNADENEEHNLVIGDLLEKLSRERESRTCVVCQDSPRVIAFKPCGHWCVCATCNRQLMRAGRRYCPCCRTYIKSTIKVYYP